MITTNIKLHIENNLAFFMYNIEEHIFRLTKNLLNIFFNTQRKNTIFQFKDIQGCLFYLDAKIWTFSISLKFYIFKINKVPKKNKDIYVGKK